MSEDETSWEAFYTGGKAEPKKVTYLLGPLEELGQQET